MKVISYAEYLKTNELLQLQHLRSKPVAHDEMLFIVIHQVYELWFKQLLHETQRVHERFEAGNGWGAAQALGRMLKILKVAVLQTDLLETMTPLSFGRFRDHLGAASGFQSAQFRALEIAWGWRNKQLYRQFKGDEQQLIQKWLAAPPLWISLCNYIRIHHKARLIKPQLRTSTQGLAYSANPSLQKQLFQLIVANREINWLCERFIDLDVGMQEWRYRHLKMVERTIGTKIGTGGSTGAKYLQKTLAQRFFPDLWALRDYF